MKVAIVHEWFVSYAGSEKVVEQIISCYPEADIYALVNFLPNDQQSFLQGKQVHTSFIQNLPFAKKYFRHYLPLMPLAIEQFDLSEYDLIISSSHAVAKGVLTSPNQLHICYCHTPMRYAWDMQHQYLKESGINKGLKSFFARYLLHKIRLWDYRTANGVDHFIANSKFIAKRIYKTYRRHAQVIYPNVDTASFSLAISKQDYYLVASRLVPYKKVSLIAEAFVKMAGKQLIIVGEGSEHYKIAKIIAGHNNIKYLGFVEDNKLQSLMQNAKAFIFAAEEDFGIILVEAQACGTPVIAFGKGGALETVNPLDSNLPTGIFFTSQNVDSVIEAVNDFDRNQLKFIPENCRLNAEKFSTERFKNEFKSFVTAKYEEFLANEKNYIPKI